MITKTKAYTSSDGKLHDSIGAAQTHELAEILNQSAVALKFEHWHVGGGGENDGAALASHLLGNYHGHLKDVLTTIATSHPRARSINGAKRKPRAKAASPGQIKDGLASMRAVVGLDS